MSKRLLATTAVLLLVLLFLGRGLQPGHVWLPLDIVTQLWPPWQQPNTVPDVHNPLLLDAVAYIYPVKQFAGEALRRGEWPLWNPTVLGGYPLTYNTQAGLFYPLTWLYAVLPPALAVNLTLVVQMVLGGWFMLGYLRQVGLRWGSALFGALLFIFNGQMVVWLLWQVVHTAVVWLPLQWWLIEKMTHQDERARWQNVGLVGLLAFAFALPWLGGHWTWALYGSLTTAVYVLWRGRLNRGWRLGLPGLALGTALALVQVLPAFNYIRQGHRAALTLSDSLANGLLNRVVVAILPHFFGSPVTSDWWGPVNFNETTIYMGVLPLLLTAVALVTLWTRRTNLTLFWALWGLVGLAWALGPGYLLLYPLPVFNGWLPSRASLIPILAITVLAALGLEQIKIVTRKTAASLFVGLVVATAVVVCGYTLYYQPDLPPLAPQLARLGLLLGAVAGWLWLALEKQWSVVWLAAVGLLLVDLLAFGYDYNTYAPVADLYPLTPTTEFLLADPEPARIASLAQGIVYYPNSATVHQLENISGYEPTISARLVRLMQVAEGERDVIRESRTLLPQAAVASPLFDLFNVKYLLSIDDWFAAEPMLVAAEMPTQWAEVEANTAVSQSFTLPAAGFQRLDLPFQPTQTTNLTVRILSADGVYEFAQATLNTDESPPQDGWVTFYFAPFPSEWGREFTWELFADTTVSIGQVDQRWGARVWVLPRPQLVHESGKTRIYLNEGYVPRAYVVPEALVVPDEKAALAQLAANQDRVGEVVVLEVVEANMPTVSGSPVVSATAVVMTETLNTVKLRVDSDGDGWLVLTDAFYPGWQATVNGQPTPVMRANSVQRAVFLSAGSGQEVIFSFWPPDWLLGLGVAFTAVLFWLLWLAYTVIFPAKAPRLPR